jgi:hypothetical protein
MNNILIVAIIILAINSIVDVICFIYENKMRRTLEVKLKVLETKFEDLEHNYNSFKGVVLDNYHDIEKIFETITRLHGDDCR